MDKSRFLSRLNDLQWHGLLYVPRDIRKRARLEGRALEDSAKARGFVNRYGGKVDDKHELGRYGELVIAWFFTMCGHQCNEPDLFSTGGHDTRIDGVRFEVKTARTYPAENQWLYVGTEYLNRPDIDRFAFVACKGLHVNIYTAAPAIVKAWPPMPKRICSRHPAVGVTRAELHTQALEMR